MNLSSDPASPSSIAHLQRAGYLHIPSALSPELLESLRKSAAHIASLARAGTWPYVRTLPKQFPPWPRSSAAEGPPPQGIWGVQHLLHPDAPDEVRGPFARAYFGEEVRSVVRAILAAQTASEAAAAGQELDGAGCRDEELVMELFNLLVRPNDDFELRWHRDDIPPTATAEEELERLGRPAWHAQWNLALYDDSSLIVVPGSHRRARTDAERNADPFEKNMPGQVIVEMKAGDVVFYDNNILHRGAYDKTKERLTLHGSMGHVKGDRDRARNVLQHAVGDFVGRCTFEELDPELKDVALQMKARLVHLGQESGEVGYFSKDE
jgi:hypothetical protein